MSILKDCVDKEFRRKWFEELIESPVKLKSSGQTRLSRGYLFPVSLIAFGLSYDMFAEASDLDDDITEFKNSNISIPPRLNSRKDRKQVLGAVFALAGAINLYLMFEDSGLSVTPGGVSYSHRF